MAVVLKIQYGDTLRRVTFESKPADGLPYYSKLESKIRDLFKISAQAPIRVTYIDKDDDVITMADDADLEDALIMQSLNPLRLRVALLGSDAPTFLSGAIPQAPMEAREDLSTGRSKIYESLKHACQSLPERPSSSPHQEGSGSSPRQISDMLETIIKTVASHISSAVEGVEAGSKPAGYMLETIRKNLASQVSSAVESAEAGSNAAGAEDSSAGSSESTKAVSKPLLKNVVQAPFPEVLPSLSRSVSTEASELRNASRIFHSGVQCDGCGMSPIAGSRFKSTKKHDYDLCLSCYKESGSSADYTRIERPLFRPRHLHPAGSGRMPCPMSESMCDPGRYPGVYGPCTRPMGRFYKRPVHHGGTPGGKLDARFVQDVTVVDGTELAPGTRFTKVWRLRNSGTLPWPSQTKLVQVGGDELGTIFVIPLELPEQGLAPEQEVEAAVVLVAPEKPGRYVSHWRLASPAGPKFGHRVWVLVQVTSNEKVAVEGKDSVGTEVDFSQETDRTVRIPLLPTPPPSLSRDTFVKTSHEALASQLSQVEEHIRYPVVDTTSNVVDIEEPFSGLKIATGKEEAAVELKEEHLVKAVADDKEEVLLNTSKVQEVENSELGGGFSMVEMPAIDSEVNFIPTAPREEVESVPLGNHSNQNLPAEEEEDVGEELSSQEDMSQKLEAMGFTNQKLNLALLEKNKQDLRRTLDDLFAAAEWDPILEELEEMGFYDSDLNLRLMFKNSGSVKRVVKELVQMYKDPAGKGKQVVTE